ncbi:MAG: hypothetical protein IPN85_18925 [Flavobacteriales bacterium]|nr:hypothetical protein [Flavobacteriales bacterium]
MKTMNGMMRMNGDLEDMGMNMGLQRMDMNTVDVPEITGAKENAQTAQGSGRVCNSNAAVRALS